MSTLTPVAFSLGSNLGDRAAHLHRGFILLAEHGVRDARLSAFFANPPWDCPPGAGPFLNAAVVGQTALSPERLLALCHHIEQELGRPADHAFHADRTLDIDLLLYGDQVRHTTALTLPHPGLTQRDFVLVPLAELAPDWVVPPGPRTVADYRAQVKLRGT